MIASVLLLCHLAVVPHGDGSGASILYAATNEFVDPATETIYVLESIPGSVRPLGDCGLVRPLDLASDTRPDSRRLFACDAFSNRLFVIDPISGTSTDIGPVGTSVPVESLAFDPLSDTLYGVTSDSALYRIDVESGEGTEIGPVGYPSILALEFDSGGTLYGVSGDAHLLITIDTSTGDGAFVAPTLRAITGMARRPEDDVVFVVETVRDTIHRLDLTDGSTQEIGPYGGGLEYMVGLAFLTPEIECFHGTVDLGNGSFPAGVLYVAGSLGDPQRRVTIETGSPFDIRVDLPPDRPSGIAPFALYVWRGEPDESTLAPQPFGLGEMCLPTPLAGGLPQPIRTWNNIGKEGTLGEPDHASDPAPSVLATLGSGRMRALTVTLQGFIVDDGSAAEVPASITNAVTLRIVD